MIVSHEPKTSRGTRLRFNLRTLLIVVILVSAYFAGRAPMMHRAQRAEQERDEYRRLAEQHKKDVLRLEKQVSLITQVIMRRSNVRMVSEPEVMIDNRMHIDAGMMIDALEHRQRFFSAPGAADLLR